MADVFISYSRQDKDSVILLHKALEARQRKAWVDLDDIRPTAEWRKDIRARAFVFVLSPGYAVSPECLKEVEHAAASPLD